MTFLKSVLSDGIDGSWSSKRIVTLLAFIFCSIAFFANLFFNMEVKDYMFEGMMVIAIAGLGVTVTEKFATRYKNKPYINGHQEEETINTRRISGTPLPRVEERER
jgi:hypothetical protein